MYMMTYGINNNTFRFPISNQTWLSWHQK